MDMDYRTAFVQCSPNGFELLGPKILASVRGGEGDPARFELSKDVVDL